MVQRSLAHSDVEKAIHYHLAVANSATALGFVDALEAGYAHSGRTPATGSPRYAHEINLSGLHAWPLTKYPYMIFYVELDLHRCMAGIAHGH
jgi:toxin ParE1/3/4